MQLLSLEQVKMIPNRRREFELIFYMLTQYNFRISEVLRLTHNSLVGPSTIIVKLSKCKDYYVFHDLYLYELLDEIFNKNAFGKFSVDYMSFYRWIKTEKPSFVIYNGSRNAHVTHASRYANAQRFADGCRNEKEIQALLRHKSSKTQKYYLKPKSHMNSQ